MMSYRFDYNENEYDPQQDRKEERRSGKKSSVVLKTISVALAGVLVGSLCAVGAMESSNSRKLAAAQEQIDQLRQELAVAANVNEDSLSSMLSQTSAGNLRTSTEDEPVVAIAKACQPSVVGVTSQVDASKLYSGNGYGSIYDYFFGFGFGRNGQSGQQGQQEDAEPNYVDYSFGSGVILSDDGYIITNNHVVESGDRYYVTLSDGSEVPATLIGADEYSDVALLKLDEKVSGLVPAVLGDSDKVNVGEMVVAIGNPLGVELMGTLTMGVVSATNREVDLEDGRTMDTIQTDAAINNGNSGGGLFNANGELIGITTLKISSSGSSSSASVEGLGFAIPINEALSIVQSLRETGTVERPTLGISAANFTQEYADRYNLEPGIYVSDVTEGSNAERAGIQRMDIITHFNGQRITTRDELQNLLNRTSFGDTVTITVIRDAESMDLEVTFERPTDPVL